MNRVVFSLLNLAIDAALSTVRGYSVLGQAGPCRPDWECPAIYQEAYDDLRMNALVANRAMWYLDQ